MEEQCYNCGTIGIKRQIYDVSYGKYVERIKVIRCLWCYALNYLNIKKVGV